MDGYNWGTIRPDTTWISPQELFGATLEELRGLRPGTPILVAEVGCAEAGGDKARWITDLVAYLDGQGDVTGFVWFDHDKETDWRLTSSRRAAAAMADALRARTRDAESGVPA
ncbi:hypothetical protein [Mycolicibacterium palauense]|uniref:hypothetical protein n=1 Tax=Mycolicibacterium palauense TaxID=2034511 RepID=UPI001FEB8FD9|nr:hypothetical protein [Mycolicibacterium palauense]